MAHDYTNHVFQVAKKKRRDQLYKRNCSTNWMFKLIVKSGLNVPCLLAQDQCETFFSLETENVWMVVMVLSCRCAGSCCQPCHVWWLRLRACSFGIFGCVQKIGTSNPMKSNIKLAVKLVSLVAMPTSFPFSDPSLTLHSRQGFIVAASP